MFDETHQTDNPVTCVVSQIDHGGYIHPGTVYMLEHLELAATRNIQVGRFDMLLSIQYGMITYHVCHRF
jgi:hypothetical protein